jgi:hypothetical protein
VGRVYQVNIPETLLVARRVTVRTHKCWSNAVQAARACRRQGVRYVEGWIVFEDERGMCHCVEHGFCELPDGSILDVSHTVNKGKLVGMSPEKRYAYFPGIKYTLDDIRSLPLTYFPIIHHLIKTVRGNQAAIIVYCSSGLQAETYKEQRNQSSKP